MTQENSAKIILNSQYIKDLSFENPNAPASMARIAKNPKIDFNVDIKAGKLNDKAYEVILNITANASDSEEKDFAIFLVELKYAGLFTVEEQDEDKIKELLLVDAPTIIFPFARRIIADCTRDGGFPPLLMEAINFSQLLENNNKKSA